MELDPLSRSAQAETPPTLKIAEEDLLAEVFLVRKDTLESAQEPEMSCGECICDFIQRCFGWLDFCIRSILSLFQPTDAPVDHTKEIEQVRAFIKGSLSGDGVIGKEEGIDAWIESFALLHEDARWHVLHDFADQPFFKRQIYQKLKEVLKEGERIDYPSGATAIEELMKVNPPLKGWVILRLNGWLNEPVFTQVPPPLFTEYDYVQEFLKEWTPTKISTLPKPSEDRADSINPQRNPWIKSIKLLPKAVHDAAGNGARKQDPDLKLPILPEGASEKTQLEHACMVDYILETTVEFKVRHTQLMAAATQWARDNHPKRPSKE